MIDTYRFIGPAAPSADRPPAEPLQAPSVAGRYDPSGQEDATPQDLAAAIAALGRQPQTSAGGLAANLAAEALLEYARRNRMEGQADPSDVAGGGGGGEYGGAPPASGGQIPDQSLLLSGPAAFPNWGQAGGLVGMGLRLSPWSSDDSWP